MTSRRTDVVYFGLIVLVVLIAYYASTRSSSDPSSPLEMPSLSAYFEPPSVALPEPVFVFRPLSSYQSPRIQRPRFSDRMETALIEVRSELLASAVPRETDRAD